MKTGIQFFTLFLAFCAWTFFAIYSSAETVTTSSTTSQQVPPGTTPINLSDFDINQDGILSSNEVGEMLFRLFDTNHDNVIDGKEYETKAIMTVVPMQRQTTISYDFDNEGLADKTQTTYESFSRNTQLARFGGNMSGLSPHEFIDQSLLSVDKDNSGSIDRTEWRSAYMYKIAPMLIKG